MDEEGRSEEIFVPVKPGEETSSTILNVRPRSFNPSKPQSVKLA